MNTFLFFLFSQRVQILKTEYKYGQYCTPLSQSDCRWLCVVLPSYVNYQLSVEGDVGDCFHTSFIRICTLFKGIVLLILGTIQTLSKFYLNSLPEKLEYCFPQLSAQLQENMSLLSYFILLHFYFYFWFEPVRSSTSYFSRMLPTALF